MCLDRHRVAFAGVGRGFRSHVRHILRADGRFFGANVLSREWRSAVGLLARSQKAVSRSFNPQNRSRAEQKNSLAFIRFRGARVYETFSARWFKLRAFRA